MFLDFSFAVKVQEIAMHLSSVCAAVAKGAGFLGHNSFGYVALGQKCIHAHPEPDRAGFEST